MQPKDTLLAPLYLYQGKKLKRTALRLPEAQGERQGNLILNSPANNPVSENVRISLSHSMHLMIIGDSSAAGVGVNNQQEALIGHLLDSFKTSDILQDEFTNIKWSLHATSGHTSFDVLRRLFLLPKPTSRVDIMVVVVGVNDTTGRVSLQQWQQQLEEIIVIGQRKFGAKNIIFSCLPPMAMMPAIPKPLNRFIGSQSDVMNKKLQEVCYAYQNVHYLAIDFAISGLDNNILFANDGFHPSSVAYQYWAKELNQLIEAIVNRTN